MKEIINESTTYWVGRNAQDNWDIINKSDKNWIWIHLDKFPSGHVIICKNSDTISHQEIIYGCNLCIINSKYKNQINLGLVYCEVTNLILGEDIGSVYFKSNRKTTKIII